MDNPSSPTTPKALIRELSAIVKDSTFVVDPAALPSEASRQFSVDGVVPGIIVSPSSNDEVADILQLAAKEDLVVVPAGA